MFLMCRHGCFAVCLPGYDKYGYDKYGYNKDSYHRDGYYKHGEYTCTACCRLALTTSFAMLRWWCGTGLPHTVPEHHAAWEPNGP